MTQTDKQFYRQVTPAEPSKTTDSIPQGTATTATAPAAPLTKVKYCPYRTYTKRYNATEKGCAVSRQDAYFPLCLGDSCAAYNAFEKRCGRK